MFMSSSDHTIQLIRPTKWYVITLLKVHLNQIRPLLIRNKTLLSLDCITIVMSSSQDGGMKLTRRFNTFKREFLLARQLAQPP